MLTTKNTKVHENNQPASSTNKLWEHFDHEADIGIRGFGKTCEQAFEQAALALTAVITPLENVHAMTPVSLSCHALNIESLFVEWLNALIYEMAVRHMLFRRFKVAIAETSLSATAWGESINTDRHHPSVEVKAATYAELIVSKTTNITWMAQCIVDV